MGMDIDNDQIEIIQEFVTESQDMIEQLEPQIIELGQNSDPETMNAIFRLFHSMKGSAGFLEFDHITRVAHAAENLLDLIRNGEIELVPDHVTLLCASCDFAKDALEKVDSDYTDDSMSDAADEISAKLHDAIEVAKGGGEPAAEPVAAEAPPEPEPEPEAELEAPKEEAAPTPAPSSAPPAANGELPKLEITEEMRLSFVQEGNELLQNAEQGLLAWGENPEDTESIGDIFRQIHSFKGNCGFFGFSHMEELSHQMENILDRVKSGSKLAVENPADQLLTALDILQQGVNDISDGKDGVIETLEEQLKQLQLLVPPLLGEFLVEEGVEEKAVAAAVETQKKPVGEILVEKGQASNDQVDNALKKQQQKLNDAKKETKPAARTKTPAKRQDIRVDLGKLDQLINLIGELVIAENMLIHNPDLVGMELENFNKAGQHMSKLVRELQEMAMSIRMIPVSGLFRRMIRLVHDISVKAGKKVDLELIGEETEIDKTVIETITDPLVHLLRNSLDHGLETPDERVASGKGEKGTVRLQARHEEGEVWVTVKDDGRGLNREKILEKAISKGLIEGDGSDLTDKQIYNMIFMPGFSTAAAITDISGRGVGMDVVKRNLEKIKGKIDVSSTPGKGTRIDLRIPLTLAIIDGMLVRVGTTTCIVPTLSILEAFRPTMDQITITPEGDELARVRENFFPIIRLHEILDKEPDSKELPDGILIVLEYQGSRFCLFVDEIVGQQQTVIKGLSEFIGNVAGVSGCTILGDGGVSLILDVGSLVESAESKAQDVELF
ncbi:two-component system, chemotaxis family, sensor kinase CheA [Malonomonas rubra DSM 5091]|uniref:Chemotaxis protein CheA n=1 Tax=Malonomonas rubra DSM 5091 TaxID=1122189 RepID=A0A1M6GAP2_MALRU|nr:chemotaxis protein CheA [Malonomonas rubra]SHJ06994.1 two-component system, chemotaxis family, sensor kinase CheA [Malonomonas rubra DSM 5091]